MRATEAKTLEIMERVDAALAEAEEAKRAYDDFMADWRWRHGIAEPQRKHEAAE